MSFLCLSLYETYVGLRYTTRETNHLMSKSKEVFVFVVNDRTEKLIIENEWKRTSHRLTTAETPKPLPEQ